MKPARLTCLPALLCMLFAVAGLCSPSLCGDEVSPAAPNDKAPSEQVSQEVAQRIGELDSPEFSTRRQAATRLEELASQPALGHFLATEFARVLASPDSSFEVRAHLEPLARALPPVLASVAASKPSVAEITPLLDQLNSDSYLQRDSAARRLKGMLAHEELIVPLWLELKARASDPAHPSSSRRLMEPLLEQAHEAWLLADPAKVPLPRPANEQIENWIESVAKLPDVEVAEPHLRTAAERELLDLIARDDTRPDLLRRLRETIAAHGESGANATLQHMEDFAKPAMAAEVWSNYFNSTVQYLIIGLPQINEDTGIATHFDEINEQTAHCVNGNSLTEGDYPVRIAIGHPTPGRESMFYLTNLPTPRRRLAYEYHIRRDQQLRLQEISQRTLDYFLTRGSSPNESEVLMLAQLDPRSVSRFVGSYFDTVTNTPLATTPQGLDRQTTVFGGICAVLARTGTREAVPALLELVASGKLPKLATDNTVDIGWIAALAIAQRDPWSGVDTWLAKLIDDDRPLVQGLDRAPTLGASAAGLLLDRHGASTQPFGLETAGELETDRYRFVGYRFTTEFGRPDVKQWWEKNKATLAPEPVPTP